MTKTGSCTASARGELTRSVLMTAGVKAYEKERKERRPLHPWPWEFRSRALLHRRPLSMCTNKGATAS